MRRAFLFAVTAALLLAAASDRAQQPTPPAPAQDSQQGATITRTVNLVDVLFTVLDRRNKLVPSLEKDDFKISDDKSPQTIRYFRRETDLPLRIGLLTDTSNSIRDRLKFEQDAATSFLFSVIRRSKDQ